jgi:glycosyltransferase involved in cell wall biosynthesis
VKVLQVISNFGIGGAEVWLIALLKYFRDHAADLGVKVETDVFLTNGVRDCLDAEAESLGARLIYARCSRKTLPSFVTTWRRTLADGHYDVIHDHQEFSAGWHFLLGSGRLPPVRITHLHNPMSHQLSYSTGALRKNTIKFGNVLVAKYSTHLLSTSRQLITDQGFDDLSAAYTLPKLAVHCGFDPSRFAGDRTVARETVLSEFGLDPESKILLFVGRLNSHVNDTFNQKNPSFCLEVAKACAAKDPNFVCLMAGSGDSMRNLLLKRVKDWGLSSQIRLLGPRDDVPTLMLGADLLLFPSLAEGLGMVAVEAQAAGLPVLASDAVPKECMLVEGMVDFASLVLGPECWSNLVLRKIVTPKTDHRSSNQAIRNSSFSIDMSSRTLIDIYGGKK